MCAANVDRKAMDAHCATKADDLVNWDRRNQRIEWVDCVEEFPTLRAARAYAQWLHREGAFEGVEDYTMGLARALA